MQVTLSQDKLAAALRTVGRAVPARHGVAALTGIALTARGSALHLRATDLEVTLPSLRVEFASGRSAVRFRSSHEARPFFAVLPLLSF